MSIDVQEYGGSPVADQARIAGVTGRMPEAGRAGHELDPLEPALAPPPERLALVEAG